MVDELDAERPTNPPGVCKADGEVLEVAALDKATTAQGKCLFI